MKAIITESTSGPDRYFWSPEDSNDIQHTTLPPGAMTPTDSPVSWLGLLRHSLPSHRMEMRLPRAMVGQSRS